MMPRSVPIMFYVILAHVESKVDREIIKSICYSVASLNNKVRDVEDIKRHLIKVHSLDEEQMVIYDDLRMEVFDMAGDRKWLTINGYHLLKYNVAPKHIVPKHALRPHQLPDAKDKIRVTYSELGVTTLKPKQPDREGTLIRYTKDKNCAVVDWDDRISEDTLAIEFLTFVNTPFIKKVSDVYSKSVVG
jgi:hypothetical protein